MNICLKAKLNAYSKSILPNNIVSDSGLEKNNDYIRTVDNDGVKSWKKLDEHSTIIGLNNNISTLSAQINGCIESNSAQAAIINEHSSDIASLNTNVTELSNNYTEIMNNYSSLDSRTSALETKVTAIDTLDDDVIEINVKIEDIFDAIEVQTTDIDEIKTNISLTEDNRVVTFSNAQNEEVSFDLDNYDDETLKKNEDGVIFVNGIKSENTTITAQTIIEDKNAQDESITSLNSNFTSLQTTVAEQAQSLSNLQSVVENLGNYLPANNFGSTVTQNALTTYALEILSSETVPDKTKVKNTNDNHTWIYNATLSQWVDNGSDDINTATNSSLGVVKGSTQDYKGSIDINGVISINGLVAKLVELESRIAELEK